MREARHRFAAIALWIAFLLSCGAVISRTTFTTDLSAFLPRTPTPEQQLLMLPYQRLRLLEAVPA